MKMKKSMLIIALSCSLGSFAQQNAETAKQDIRKVLSTYMNCLINKDSATFVNLFAMDSVSFYGVNSTDTYQEIIKKYPKAPLIQKDNYRNFIRFVVSSKKKAEEKYNNINIWNDNSIATLSFDYSFWIDDKETNWGIETWQLLYKGKEWKIMSALFSINDPRVTPDTGQKTGS
jgi:hypothetical protein